MAKASAMAHQNSDVGNSPSFAFLYKRRVCTSSHFLCTHTALGRGSAHVEFRETSQSVHFSAKGVSCTGNENPRQGGGSKRMDSFSCLRPCHRPRLRAYQSKSEKRSGPSTRTRVLARWRYVRGNGTFRSRRYSAPRNISRSSIPHPCHRRLPRASASWWPF